MSDRPLALVTAVVPEEGPAEHIRNAQQMLAHLRYELADRALAGAEVSSTLVAAENRLGIALKQMRHQVIVQPIREDPYGEPVRLVTPEPAPIVFGEEQDD